MIRDKAMKAMMIDKVTYRFNMWRVKMRYHKVLGNHSSRAIVAVIAAMLVAICIGIPGTAVAAVEWGVQSTETTWTGSGTASRANFLTLPYPTGVTNVRVIAIGHREGNTAGSMRFGLYHDTDGDPTNGGTSLCEDMGSRTNVGTNTWNWHALSNPYDWSSGYVYPIFNTTGCTGTYSYNTGGNNMGDNDNDYGNYNVGTVADCSVAYGSTLNMTGMGAQTITYGQNVVYVRYPSISTVSDTTPNPGQTGIVISGAGFETQNQYNGTSFGSVFTGTTSKLWLTNNINWGSETVKVAQTITNWTDTSVTFTCAQGGLSFGTVYLFVENSDGEINGPGTSNTGYAITLTNPSDPATTTGTLSVNSQTDTSFALNATYTGDDAPNDDNNCSMQYQDGSWLDITNEVVTRASKQWDGSVTAILKPGTTYNVQATFTDAQGVSGTNPLTTTATTTYLGLGDCHQRSGCAGTGQCAGRFDEFRHGQQRYRTIPIQRRRRLDALWLGRGREGQPVHGHKRPVPQHEL